MAVVPPIKVSIIADSEKLVAICHDLLDDKCEHTVGAIFSMKSCEVMAQNLIDRGGFLTTGEFASKLTENEEVQKVVIDAMAQAWWEGHDSICTFGEFCPDHQNPYTT